MPELGGGMKKHPGKKGNFLTQIVNMFCDTVNFSRIYG